jgi:crotonobetainyl-CoA:carnitine CoA-transferase CaiB-like acyl-CoA transferase
MVPFQNFATEDGWLVVACPKQSLWQRLCEAVGRSDLATHERYASFADRYRNRDELLDALDAIFAARRTAEWVEVLTAAGVPCAPVNDVAGALGEEQVAARGGLVEIDHPVLGLVRQVRSPFRFEGVELPAARGPFRGEDTAAVLRDLCGYSDGRIDELGASGVFGDVAIEEVRR